MMILIIINNNDQPHLFVQTLLFSVYPVKKIWEIREGNWEIALHFYLESEDARCWVLVVLPSFHLKSLVIIIIRKEFNVYSVHWKCKSDDSLSAGYSVGAFWWRTSLLHCNTGLPPEHRCRLLENDLAGKYKSNCLSHKATGAGKGSTHILSYCNEEIY